MAPGRGESRGFVVHSSLATGAELPADTSPFARALGFGQRSSLENDGAGGSHLLPNARTDSVAIPWKEAAELIDSSPDWVLCITARMTESTTSVPQAMV